MKDWFRRKPSPPPVPQTAESCQTRARNIERATAWLEARRSGRLTPPQDVHDSAAWDTYWTNHLQVGPVGQGFSDVMSSDSGLIRLLRQRGATTILCAGNGLSGEALSLALHGFHVTALDLAPLAGATIAEGLRHPDCPLRALEGFRPTDTGVAFDGSGPIPFKLCPRIHQGGAHTPCRGGSLSFVAGDLTVPEVCPGPFDVVIERRTVQLFPEPERQPALDALAARLAEHGTFVSHLHDGGGWPGRHRPHHTEGWAEARGFVIDSCQDEEVRRSARRLLCRRLTTG